MVNRGTGGRGRGRGRGFGRVVALAASLACVLAACGSGGGGTSGRSADAVAVTSPADCDRPAEQVDVTIGIRPSLIFANVYLAHARGYFKDENLNVSLEPVDPASALQLVASGDIDAVATGLSAGLFNAIYSGLDLYPIAPGGVDADAEQAQFFVRTDLIESGEVKEMADLKGRRVGMPGVLGGGPSQKVALLLAQGNLGLTDVVLQNVAYPDMAGAFANGSIDAAYVTSGGAGAIEEKDLARQFGDQSVYVGVNTNAIVAGPSLIKERPDVGRAILRAIMRASAELQDKYYEDAQILDDLSSATDIGKDVIAKTARSAFAPDLAFTPESWETVQRHYADAGVLDYSEVKPFDQIVTDSLRQSAVDSVDKCGLTPAAAGESQ